MAGISPLTEADRELFARELDDFVPDAVFDGHTHLWARAHLPPDSGDTFSDIPGEAIDISANRRFMAEMLPGRRLSGLYLPGAVAAKGAQLQAHNEFMGREIQAHPDSRGSLLVSPDMDPEYVRSEVRRLGLVGLKPYHLQALPAPDGNARPTWEANIPEYLPEAQVRVAHEEKLCITLHMVKARAVADPANQHWIRHYCEAYPDMRLILAHAARGFNPYHTIQGLPALRGLPNLYFDMSGVTEVGACEAIIEIMGHDRLLYGSDFPVSHLRGRCVAIGDGFLWLYEDTLDWRTASHQALQPVLVGLESLRVLKQAAWHCHLSDSQIEDLFFGNARRLFGLA